MFLQKIRVKGLIVRRRIENTTRLTGFIACLRMRVFRCLCLTEPAAADLTRIKEKV